MTRSEMLEWGAIAVFVLWPFVVESILYWARRERQIETMKRQYRPSTQEERRIIEHYENQTEDEALEEAETIPSGYVRMDVPAELVERVEELISLHLTYVGKA